MPLFKSRYRPKVVDVQRFDGDTPNGGVSCNVYIHEDESVRTIEFNRTGGHVAEYEGEPRPLAPEPAPEAPEKKAK